MSQRRLVVLTVFNLLLGSFLISRVLIEPQTSVAAEQPGVLRGRALEIVDDHGKVRASIQVLPAKGEEQAETVLLRLIDRNGQPSVKLGTSEREAGLSLVGGDDVSYVVLKADLEAGSLKMTSKSDRQQLIHP
jgi:hypothetical protein